MRKIPKKIGFNGRPFCQEGMRGLSRHTLELIRNLKLQHPELEFYIYSYDRISDSYKKELPYAHFRDQKRRPKILWDLFYLGRDVKKDNLDLFHSTNNLGVPLLVNRQMPIFTTIHDHFTHSARIGWGALPKFWWACLNYRIEFFLARRSHAFFTVSESAKVDISRIMDIPESKITVAYNGVNLLAQTGLTELSDFYLYVGGLDARKNILTMLLGFKAFAEESSLKPVLKIAGSPHLASSEVQDVLRNNTNLFTLTGNINDEALAKLYQGARALIFPSLEEGFGLPLVEAMALNCPIIASDIPVFKEIAQDAALYFSVREPLELKKRLLEIENAGHEREKLMLKGRERVQKFSWDKMAREVYETYMKFF